MFPNITPNSFIKLQPNSNIFCVRKNNSMNAIEINESAKSILELCDGTNSLEDIICILKNKYSEDETVVAQFVNEFLQPFIDLNIVINKKSKVNSKLVKGSSKVFLPNALTWEITDYCPLKCRHCYISSKNNNGISKKDIDYILNLIDYTGVYTVQLTGGEALTHPHIKYIINELVDRGLTIIISTSGTYYKDDMFEFLTRLKDVGGSLRVSIDGNREAHNYIRRNDLAFDRSIEFIKKAIHEGIHCQVATTVIDQTPEEIESITVKLKDMGVSVHSIGLVSIQGDAKENDLHATYNKSTLNKLLEYLSDKYSSETFEVQLPQDTKSINCGGGYNLIRIRPNLDVTPCPMMELKFGNLKEQTIDQVMDKAGRAFHDIHSPSEKHCKGCKLEFICGKCTSSALIGKNLSDKCPWYESQSNLLESLINKI